MRLLLIALLMAPMLAGCDASEPLPEHVPINTSFHYDLRLVDDMPLLADGREPWELTQPPTADSPVCVVRIPAAKYPRCLLHAQMHCISNNWHEGRDSTEYCHY